LGKEDKEIYEEHLHPTESQPGKIFHFVLHLDAFKMYQQLTIVNLKLCLY